MKRGESILIHSGTGGIGQAAISLALHFGCTVYTTVGTQEKRDYLKKEFPQLTGQISIILSSKISKKLSLFRQTHIEFARYKL